MLSGRLRALRMDRGLSQRELAAKASLSLQAVRSLEAGAHSSVSSLIRALHALGAAEGVDALAPRPSVSPIQVFRGQTHRKRVSRPHTRDGA